MIHPELLSKRSVMLLKITSKRQVTFPRHVLDAMGLVPGDRIVLIGTEDGYLLKPRFIDLSKLCPLKDRIRRNPAFNMDTFRTESHDPSLRG